MASFLNWQLGLPEKNIVSYDFDLAQSDPSDANTNSTTLFSDDTDDKSRRNANPELSIAVQQEVSIKGILHTALSFLFPVRSIFTNTPRPSLGHCVQAKFIDLCFLSLF